MSEGDYDFPLELGDIMPQNRKLYDKMRPPKYKGKPERERENNNNCRKKKRTNECEGEIESVIPRVPTWFPGYARDTLLPCVNWG